MCEKDTKSCKLWCGVDVLCIDVATVLLLLLLEYKTKVLCAIKNVLIQIQNSPTTSVPSGKERFLRPEATDTYVGNKSESPIRARIGISKAVRSNPPPSSS